MSDVDDFLEHFGVKGMRWGVRKKSGSVDTSVESTTKGRTRSEDAKTAAKSLQRSKKQGVGSLSNQELKALNERMNLESSYRQLNAKKKNGAAKFVQETLSSVGKELSKEIVKGAIKGAPGKIRQAGDNRIAEAIADGSLNIPLSAMWGD